MVKFEDYFSYDKETGTLTWKITVNSRSLKGEEAGSFDKLGYRRVGLFGKSYKVHRIAWYLHYGVLPSDWLDHINGIKSDNRISNLREASRKQNSYNRKRSKSNSSGIKGVVWHKRDKKWMAAIESENKNIFVGYFKCKEKAREAVEAKRIELHGEFHNHG